MRILRSLSEKILPALFWIMIMLAFDTPAMCIMTCLAAALHELGHICAAIFVSDAKISLPRATLKGLKIDTGRLLSYKEELIIALGGPLSNIAAFLLLLPLSFLSSYIRVFALLNLLTAISNLIPIRSYDGHRILRTLLISRIPADDCERIMSNVTLFISSAGVLLSLLILMICGEGYWIFAILFIVFIRELQKRH